MSEHIPFPSRMKRLKSLPVLPTLLTSGNLACGVTSIIFAFHGDITLAATLIFIGMVCDMLDGKVARMTHTEGQFGAELDSLADAIAFGVAPAMLIHNIVLPDSVTWEGAWFITVVYPVFAAIRLARYNVEDIEHEAVDDGHSDGGNTHFKGIPSPGAAALICSWAISYQLLGGSEFFAAQGYENMVEYILLGMTACMGFLMVSNIRFPHIGNTVLSRNMGFKKFILLFSCVYALVYICKWHSLAVITTGYVLYGVIPGIIWGLKKWHGGKSLLDDDDDGFDPRMGVVSETGDAAHDEGSRVSVSAGRVEAGDVRHQSE